MLPTKSFSSFIRHIFRVQFSNYLLNSVCKVRNYVYEILYKIFNLYIRCHSMDRLMTDFYKPSNRPNLYCAMDNFKAYKNIGTSYLDKGTGSNKLKAIILICKLISHKRNNIFLATLQGGPLSDFLQKNNIKKISILDIESNFLRYSTQYFPNIKGKIYFFKSYSW